MKYGAPMNEAGNTLDGQEPTDATQPKLSKKIWVSSAWFATSIILGGLAWYLKLLKTQSVYIFLTPDIHSDTLSIAMMLLAIGPLIIGSHGFVRLLKNHAPNRGFPRLGKAFGVFIATCGTVILLLSALVSILKVPNASYVLQSPHDDRSVLVLNQSFLRVGTFPIYEPRTWPVYSQTTWIQTDDGFDPFASGQYTETWTDAGLELEYLFDDSQPDSFVFESIQLPK